MTGNRGRGSRFQIWGADQEPSVVAALRVRATHAERPLVETVG